MPAKKTSEAEDISPMLQGSARGKPRPLTTEVYDSGLPDEPMVVYALEKGFYGDRLRLPGGPAFEIKSAKYDFSHNWMSQEKPDIDPEPKFSSAQG